MPFVSDNSNWKLIDDEEQFFVVRKLHIVPTKHFVQEFSVDQIRQCVRKFGEIESIELLANQRAAHVTFVSDSTAYFMLLQHEFDKKMENEYLLEVRPADSSHQPQEDTDSSPENSVEQSSEIFKLDEETLLYLFKFLDIDSAVSMADVCQMFRRLLVQHHFPMIRKFELIHRGGYPLKFANSLVQLNRTLQFVGQYISELTVYITLLREPLSMCKQAIINPIRKILVANIGTNLRRASISMPLTTFPDDTISYLSPILHHLEQLEIVETSSLEYGTPNPVDFQTMCPNLVEFKLRGSVRMTRCEKPWDRLRHLAINGSHLFDDEEILQSYFEWNPQLTCVEFDLHFDNGHIFSVLASLRLLEKLSIHCDFWYNHDKASCLYGQEMARLRDLQHLKEIKLRTTHCGVDLNRVFDCLATFVGLRIIRLYCDTDEQIDEQSLVNLARLPNLEHLIMEMKNNESITKASLVNFVRFAGQLKILELKHWSLELQLVDISKCEPPSTLTELNSSEFMHLKAFGNDEAQSYLQLED